MRLTNWVRSTAVVAFTSVVMTAQPALARRTVIDGGAIATVSGYCAPNSVGTSDCDPRALPFVLQIGGTSYDSFVINGNGTLSLGAAIDFGNATGLLTDYGLPVFSPLIDNGLVSVINHFTSQTSIDTKWVAAGSISGNSLTVEWFPCSTRVFCGSLSIDDPSQLQFMTQEEIDAAQLYGLFGMTLTNLGDGFTVDYFYNAPADLAAPYGFHLPGAASVQIADINGPRSFRFDSVGQLVAPVPEPGTWGMMLIGFGLVGANMRRQRKRSSGKSEPLGSALFLNRLHGSRAN